MADDSSRIPDQYIISQLESLLHKKLGQDLVLLEYTATSLLPPGENYGSLILKVDAKIRRNDDEGKETQELNLIAKVPPESQEQREMFDSPFTFKKERFMYETILPTYRKLELDCGIIDSFDIEPELYSSRLSILEEDLFDDDAIILMENLKTRDYYTGNRYVGLDFQHAKLAVRALARFHALGLAMKTRKPEFFEILRIRSKCMELKDPEHWKGVMEALYKNIKEDSVVGKYYERCMKILKIGADGNCWLDPPIEPWSTVIHSDFWINNIMFHRNETTKLVDDVKFVDFQNYLLQSPMRDLTFLLGCGINHDVGITEINLLIDHYHDTLIERLKLMSCDTSPYERESFNEQLIKDAHVELTHSAFMLKILTKDVDVDDPDSRNVVSVIMNSCSEMFYVRLRHLVASYMELGWM